MIGDALVILCSLFWALHIIFAGKFMEKFNIPIFYAALQAALVFGLSLIFAFILEEVVITKILTLEGVFATIAGWIILSQVLNINNIIGCVLILIAVIFSQIAPTSKKSQVNN